MSLRQTATCFFFLTLCGQHSDIITAQEVHSGREGEDITVRCRFYWSGRRMFCRETCDNNNNILLQTDSDSAENNKYKLTFIKRDFLKYDILNVTIKHLTKSDEGRYRCELERWISDGKDDFLIRVTDASTTPKLTSAARPPSPTVQSTSLPALSSTLLSVVPESSKLPEQEHDEMTTTAPPSDLVVYVLVAWGVISGLLVLSVLIFCKRRRAKTKDAGAAAAQCANMMEQDSRVYEEINDAIGQNKSPGKISTVYATINHKGERDDGLPEASGSTKL
ncbi:CMRF35-like molecule 5 isoform X2 [Thalassophryne amazonica]|uniref:CMRF35-like molecule 5 isoform X2 n=1 Tax=Thalassophryne amazonica TaxID=390379 RepID=UPI0014721AD3|nr:CMRF35-like molecule 5 isoform X2 [Thalassophryne amazonica]